MPEHLKHPGPFKSCLNPYAKKITHAWFQERKSAREIQEMLKKHGIDVADTTILRFIKRRLKHPDPHVCNAAISKKKKFAATSRTSPVETLDFDEVIKKYKNYTARQFMLEVKQIEAKRKEAEMKSESQNSSTSH